MTSDKDQGREVYMKEHSMSQFVGKVVLITGGNAGIGRATAIEFAKQGAKVVVSGRREKEGQDVVAEIKALGSEAIFAKTDVSKASDVKAMIEQTLATFGRLDFAQPTQPVWQPFPRRLLQAAGYDGAKAMTRQTVAGREIVWVGGVAALVRIEPAAVPLQPAFRWTAIIREVVQARRGRWRPDQAGAQIRYSAEPGLPS